jgi:hypothetical protein
MFKLINIGNQDTNSFDGSKSETKTIFEECYSVQFFLNGKIPSYLFKLRNTSTNKPYILVNQNSAVFRELNVGDIMDMEYNPPESLGNGKLFKTLITSKKAHDRYVGYSIVELSIIDN